MSEICSWYVQMFAIVGMACLYVAIAFLTYVVVKKILGDDPDGLSILAAIFWPLAVVFGGAVLLGNYLVRLIILPIVAATKSDLARSEQRLIERIEESKPASKPVKNVSGLPFKKGDIITGHPANKDNYKILYFGCKCKVLSIKENGSMQLQLIDHADKNLKSEVGRVFTAPARNFIPYRKK